MKKANSFIIFILVSTILFVMVAPVLADNPPLQTIYISSVDDLRQLSKNCSFDIWSQGKTIVLETNLDLKDEAFTPIPTFGGIFDGNGHTIKGLSILVEGSNQGLFRYLQENATIKNLNVEGVVTPKGDKSSIGGIVGHNSGVIENCNATAYIKGRDIVGGLVGWNGTSGKIINSSFRGTIYGESRVGGIAGYNAGTILRCSNESSVNTTVEENKLDFQNITIEDINLERLISDAMDIGGIAGVNTGAIINSENKGIIGYPSVGYNVGGIVGRQSGYINDCVNYGATYGRKDVGGIVGQMEPYVNTLISTSRLEELQEEMNTLQTSLNRFINNARYTSDLTTRGFSQIQQDMDDSMVHLKALVNQTEELINKDIKEINKISITAIEALNRLIPIVESFESIVDIMGEAVNPIKSSLRSLSIAMDQLSEAMEKYQGLSDSMGSVIAQMQEAMESISGAMTLITEALDIIIQALEEDDVLEAAFSDLIEELQKDIPDMTRVTEYLGIIATQLGEISSELREGKVLEKLRDAFDYLRKAGENIGNVLDELENAGEQMSEIVDILGEATSNISNALDDMADALEIIQRAQDDIADVFAGIVSLLEYITANSDFEFQTTDDQYQKTREKLFTSIGDMTQSLSTLMDDMSLQGNTMMDDMQAVSDQLFKVINLMFSIITDLSIDEDYLDDIVEDVSGEDIDNSTEGKVSNNRNLGTVEGDINVGGIVGAMSIELRLDPEDDLSFEGRLTAKTVFQTRATVIGCINEGNIISKKNNVGGVVGNMYLGYIKDCVVTGTIESTAGNYIGGIAGKSYGPIVSSYAKCILQGGNYIGGIAGFGKEIIDCYTLVKINRSKACVGAIAGDIDNSSNIKRNYFVSDTIHGIDGISYAKKAEPIDYDTLVSIEDVPSVFRQFYLTFWADDKLVKTIDFNYGQSIPENELPQVPLKRGYHGRWENLDISNLIFDAKIQALYTPHVTILESEEKRNEVLPIVLVEGKFTEQDVITLTRADISSNERRVLEQLNIIIPDDGEATHIIRYHPIVDKGKVNIYIRDKGAWEKADAKWDGKYLVFESQGNNIVFKAIDEGTNIAWIWVVLACIVLTISIVIAVVSRARRKNTKIAG